MTALVFRTDPHNPVQVVDEDDGCQPGNHRRDALCARTPLAILPQDDEPDDERGGAT
ncbi:hypothetical protein [Dactylosporangium sp. CA-139066]|uniref:hypothetical protein n=1 Tax=Dactylosporangium sp. CA-139066 TaxID=3239930 RepID=UPI003D8A187B